MSKKSLRVVFAGTPAFAALALQALLDSSHEVIAVYTQPDRPAGRGQKLTPSPVKTKALSANIPVYQPTTLKDKDTQAVFASLNADVLVVAAYGLIIPAAILAMPKHGGINIHPSLLPRWRGAAPLQRTIFSGDTETGVTIMQMDDGLDTGPILYQTHYTLRPDETTASLHDELAKTGAAALIHVLDLEAVQPLPRLPQDNSQATYAAKIVKEEAKLDWTKPAAALSCLIRAFNPWPIAHTDIHGETVRVWQAAVLPGSTKQAPGTIVSATSQGLAIAAGDGTMLNLLSLQWAGGKVLLMRDVMNARKDQLIEGDLLS